MTAVDDTNDSLKSKEDSLRNFLSEKPRNAKVMSQLSSVLLDRSKTHPPDSVDAAKLRNEATVLAKQAIQGAPGRPFGYAALSNIPAQDWSDRSKALTQAIELSSDRFRVARIALLVRLLIEGREEESRRVKGKIGKGSKTHPSRKDLTVAENKTYQRIVDDLGVIWNDDDHSSYSKAEKELISKHEFGLGQFFRKKLPAETHQPRARHHFRQSRIHAPSPRQNEMAGFWLATIQHNNDHNSTINATSTAVDKCPAEYVVGLYSTFAAKFDELLVEKLHYQTPTKLRQLVDSVLIKDDTPTTKRFQHVCDLGCGTGLSGLAFQELIVDGQLIGVDLSPEMLDQARKRGCYSDLHLGDVETTLEKIFFSGEENAAKTSSSETHHYHCCDLILACDVFCYIGDLEGVFQAVARSLTTGGYFCFSTELLEEKDTATTTCPPFRLHACARFSHRQSYVEDLANDNAFLIVKMQAAAIRKNQGSDVKGLLVVLQKL